MQGRTPEWCAEGSWPDGSLQARSGGGVDGVGTLGIIRRGRVAKLNGVVIGPLRIEKIQEGRSATAIGALHDFADFGCLRQGGCLDTLQRFPRGPVVKPGCLDVVIDDGL